MKTPLLGSDGGAELVELFSDTIRTLNEVSLAGFFVEQIYQEVHGKLALALGSGVKTVMPAFYIVVSSYRLHIDAPTGSWPPGVAFYPRTRYVVH